VIPAAIVVAVFVKSARFRNNTRTTGFVTIAGP